MDNIHYGKDEDRVTVAGFDVPNSPDASYDNVYTRDEDDEKKLKNLPMAPPQLLHSTSLLSHPMNNNTCESLPSPHNATLNHLYIESRESQDSPVVLGVTNRFREKYVTVVLYKASPRR
ncbi:hypothetical protein ACS0TY_015783 [Phlomoides rotata]